MTRRVTPKDGANAVAMLDTEKPARKRRVPLQRPVQTNACKAVAVTVPCVTSSRGRTRQSVLASRVSDRDRAGT